MFQVIFRKTEEQQCSTFLFPIGERGREIFNDWILIKQIIVSSTPFVLGEIDFQKSLLGVLSGELGHEQKCIDSVHFLGMWTPWI